MKPLRETNIDVSPESIRPFGDFVLVKPDPAPEHQGSIEIPESAIAAQKEYGLQSGTVVACGPGDEAIGLECKDCGKHYNSTLEAKPEGDPNCGAVRVVYAIANCPQCGSSSMEFYDWQECGGITSSRRPMHVKPGDTVIFPRVPANRVTIHGEDYVMLHEQQHCLAVIEP